MIHPRDLLIMGTRQVFRHRSRYYGGIVAIALGTCGFIIVTSLGREIKSNVNRDLDLIGGATMVKVSFRTDMAGYEKASFRPDTKNAVARLPGVAIVSQTAMKWGSASSSLHGKQRGFPLVGVDDAFWSACSFSPRNGRFFSSRDISERRKVCVLGAPLATRLFGSQPPLGQLIRIDHDYYEIVGLLEGPGVGDLNEFAFLPITTARDRIANLSPENKLYVRCRTWDDVESVAAMIPEVVARRQSTIGLEVEVATAMLKHVKRIAWWVKAFVFISISATLCLGATGIWHGMMAAVRSRTREIGLKKAMGATNRDIMAQFLAESLCLSIGSTLAGTAVGWIALAALGLMLNINPAPGLIAASMLTSIVVSIMLGVAAGYYPSAKAARLEVISAVRFE
jgi:putative ABC transport system permease protein